MYPEAGTVLKEGDTVTLYISKGPKIIYSTMTHCVGQSVEAVQAQMDALNLVAVFEKVESDKPEGEVLSQSIDVNESVPEGTTVTFTYSEGPRTVYYPISFAVPYSEEPVLVQIFLDNEIAYDQEVPGDQGSALVTLEGEQGSHWLRIFIENQLWSEQEIIFQ